MLDLSHGLERSGSVVHRLWFHNQIRTVDDDMN